MSYREALYQAKKNGTLHFHGHKSIILMQIITYPSLPRVTHFTPADPISDETEFNSDQLDQIT